MARKRLTSLPEGLWSKLALERVQPLDQRNSLDELVYQIEGDRAVLTKAMRAATDDPFRTFQEWNSEADRKAYAKL